MIFRKIKCVYNNLNKNPINYIQMETIRKQKKVKSEEKNDAEETKEIKETKTQTSLNGRAETLENIPPESNKPKRLFQLEFKVDLLSLCIFICGVMTRMYKLKEPKNIV